jgi:hypothetical protein
MKRAILNMPFITGGGGISLDDVAVYFGFGSGLSVNSGDAGKYLNKYIPQEN